MQEIIKLEIQISCVTSEWMHMKLDYCATLHSFSISPLLSLCHALKHISPPNPPNPPHAVHRRQSESMCTNESALFVVLFQTRAISSSLFERAADHV